MAPRGTGKQLLLWLSAELMVASPTGAGANGGGESIRTPSPARALGVERPRGASDEIATSGLGPDVPEASVYEIFREVERRLAWMEAIARARHPAHAGPCPLVRRWPRRDR